MEVGRSLGVEERGAVPGVRLLDTIGGGEVDELGAAHGNKGIVDGIIGIDEHKWAESGGAIRRNKSGIGR